MSDAKFIGGLLVKPPHERAPEYVKAKLSIKREELIAWLQTEQGEWINADIKVSSGGKWYAAVDDWKPQGGQRSGPPQRASQPPARNPPPPVNEYPDDDIPF